MPIVARNLYEAKRFYDRDVVSALKYVVERVARNEETKEWKRKYPEKYVKKDRERTRLWMEDENNRKRKNRVNREHYKRNKQIYIDRAKKRDKKLKEEDPEKYSEDNRKRDFRRKLRKQGLPIPEKITLGPKYTSQEEKIIRLAIEKYIKGYKFVKVKLSWNRNPRTNYPLEFDFYCKELNLAIEYQGQQHYQRWGRDKTEKDFEDRQYRDQVKRDNCKRMGVTLFEHKYNEKVSTLIQKIKIFIELFV